MLKKSEQYKLDHRFSLRLDRYPVPIHRLGEVEARERLKELMHYAYTSGRHDQRVLVRDRYKIDVRGSSICSGCGNGTQSRAHMEICGV